MNKNEIERMLRAAAEAQRTGQRDNAARLYRDVLKRGGEQPVALNALGMQALAASAFVEAQDFFRRAIAVDPLSIDLRMNLATARRRQGDIDGERAALESALALDQRHFMASVRLAELFERSDDPARASERWRGVLAMAPLLEERTPALEAMLEHAQSQVARQQQSFADAIENDLASIRTRHAPDERRRFDACIDHMLGRRQIYSNICAGLQIPFLPADEFFDRRHFPWLEKVEQSTVALQEELSNLLDTAAPGFEPYVAMDPGTPINKWSPLDQKLDWSALHLWKNGVRDDSVCARCPQTTALMESLPLARIPGRAPTVFFSILRPGTHLPAHTGVTNMRTIIHLPLLVPDACTFRVGGETRTWRTGEAWAFDDTIEHEAWNRSDQLRAILIFDVWNPHLAVEEQEMLSAFFPIADRHGYAGPRSNTD